MRKFLNDTSAEFVGYRLEVFQKALEIHPSEFENELGWNQQKWDQWQSGECLPEILDMVPFSELYNVTLDYIYRGDMSDLADWISKKIRLGLRELILSTASLPLPALSIMLMNWKGLRRRSNRCRAKGSSSTSIVLYFMKVFP